MVGIYFPGQMMKDAKERKISNKLIYSEGVAMLRVDFRTGKNGRIRWFAVNKDSGVIQYSCFPLSFDTDQEAWEHAEWAIGAGATLEFVDPSQGFVISAEERNFS